MSIFGDKTKRPRQRKTIEEKIHALAEQALFKAMKEDETVRIQYIKQKFGIDIPRQSERTFTRLVEQTKVRAYQTVADDLVQDPEVIEALRDKCIDELLGPPPNQPRAKGKGGRSQQPNFQSQFEKVKQTIQLADKYRELLGVNESFLSKVLQNPKFMEIILALVQGLIGSSGLPQATATADSKEREFYIEKDGERIQVDYKTYVQYISKQKGLQSPGSTPIKPDQNGPTDKPAAAKHKPKFWLPPISSAAKIPEPGKEKAQEVDSQPTAVQQNDGEAFMVCVAKIIEAMDKPVEEFVKKTVASSRAGDKESLQIKDFVLSHRCDDILKELSRDGGHAEQFEKNRQWYDQVREALRTQL